MKIGGSAVRAKAATGFCSGYEPSNSISQGAAGVHDVPEWYRDEPHTLSRGVPQLKNRGGLADGARTATGFRL